MKRTPMTVESLRQALLSGALLALAPRGAIPARYSEEINEMTSAVACCSPIRILEEIPDLLWVISRGDADQRGAATSLLQQALELLVERPDPEDVRSLVKLVLYKWLLPRAERRVSKTISRTIATEVTA